MPAEIVDDLRAALTALTKLQHWPLEIEAIGMKAGEERELRGDLRVRAVQTFHPVPSLAYERTMTGRSSIKSCVSRTSLTATKSASAYSSSESSEISASHT